VAETLVILPTYNEIESLESILGRIRQALPDSDVLVVDDSSPDGTGDLADSLASIDSAVTVMHRATKDGLGRAYLAGFHHGLEHAYRYIIEIDADGSHDPIELPSMVDLARGGADLVVGSRWVPGGSVRNWPWIRVAISRAGNFYSRMVLGSHIHDLTSGFRVYRAEALAAMLQGDVASQGYCFQVELAWRMERSGRVVKEHPIAFLERATGRSKMHSGIVAEALLRVTWWGLTRGVRREPSVQSA
jgi:dolichol-phosphate mannosyltransferase